MSEYQTHNIQKMIAKAAQERRKRKLWRTFYHLREDFFGLCLCLGIVALAVVGWLALSRIEGWFR